MVLLKLKNLLITNTSGGPSRVYGDNWVYRSVLLWGYQSVQHLDLSPLLKIPLLVISNFCSILGNLWACDDLLCLP